ncbi:MAG: non-homologous end-joining DNA ligase [Dongiaceae bacterium]
MAKAARDRAERSLTAYRRKRDFGLTREPGGRVRRHAGVLSFVVQKHAARRLHYDFRLELGGVMKSWAVTKGPSLDPRVRRLAVHVEDHPIEYSDFEGTIPPGQYGGGTVMIWDRGTWEPAGDPARGYRDGKLSFRLNGRRLKGDWALVRMDGRGGDRRENWLLMKKKDVAADAADGDRLLRAATTSIVSQRTMHQIAAAGDRVWRSNRSAPAPTDDPPPARISGPARRGKRAPMPTVIASQQANVQGPREDKPAEEITLKTPASSGRNRKSSSKSKRGGGSSDVIDSLRFTHPDRVLYPEIGLTKRGLAEYYLEIADWILPEVARRPLSLVRCPDGLGKGCFYQKHLGASPPEDLRCARIEESAGPTCYAMIEDAKGLVSLVQMAVLEIHPWGARIDRLERPDRMVFDLDPDPAVAWTDVIAAARETHDRLQALRLRSFVKTTGGKGLHVVVPLARRHDWAQIRGFAKRFAEAMAAESPRRYTARMAKASRPGRIFIDYLRNARGATAVAAYSARAKPRAPVATPLAWEELDPGLRSDHFTVETLPRRLAGLGADPWRDIGRIRQSLAEPG